MQKIATDRQFVSLPKQPTLKLWSGFNRARDFDASPIIMAWLRGWRSTLHLERSDLQRRQANAERSLTATKKDMSVIGTSADEIERQAMRDKR